MSHGKNGCIFSRATMKYYDQKNTSKETIILDVLKNPQTRMFKKTCHTCVYILLLYYIYIVYMIKIYYISFILYYIILYHMLLHYSILYYITLYHIIIYYIILLYIIYIIYIYYVYDIYIYVYIDSLFIVDDKEIPVRNAWPGEAPLSICPKGSRLAMAMRSPLHPGTKITTWVCLKIVYP